jgi:hypothetical protein
MLELVLMGGQHKNPSNTALPEIVIACYLDKVSLN